MPVTENEDTSDTSGWDSVSSSFVMNHTDKRASYIKMREKRGKSFVYKLKLIHSLMC